MRISATCPARTSASGSRWSGSSTARRSCGREERPRDRVVRSDDPHPARSRAPRRRRDRRPPRSPGRRRSATTGVFLVQGEPLRERTGLLPPDTIAIEDGRVAIASAGSAKVKLKAKSDGTRVRARIGGPKRTSGTVARSAWNRPSFRNELAAFSWNVLMGLVGFSTPPRPPPPLRLEAWISPDCQVMTGELRGGSERMRREFVAVAPVPAPDGVCAPGCSDPRAFCHRAPGSAASPVPASRGRMLASTSGFRSAAATARPTRTTATPPRLA